jgi:hypothetical protein
MPRKILSYLLTYCKILGFRCGVVETFALQGCYTAYVGNCLLKLLVLELLALEDGRVGCPEILETATNIRWATSRKNERLINFLFTVSRTNHIISIADRRQELCLCIKGRGKYNKSDRKYDRRKEDIQQSTNTEKDSRTLIIRTISVARFTCQGDVLLHYCCYCVLFYKQLLT